MTDSQPDEPRRPRRRIVARPEGRTEAAQTVEVAAEFRTPLTCNALHPGAKRGEEKYRGQVHGVEITTVPFYAEPTGLVTHNKAHIDPLCIPARCLSEDCRMITEYRIAKPPERLRRRAAAGGSRHTPTHQVKE